MFEGTIEKDIRGAYRTMGKDAFRHALDAEPVEPAPAAQPEPTGKPPKKPLSAFLVDHADTVGMSWAEIDALRPPIIIQGFLRRGEVLLLGAESKSRKSWLAQDAGFAVASGFPWLADEHGENGFQTMKARVHVLDLELNTSEIRFRFAKARGNRFPDDMQAQRELTESIAAYSFDGMNVADILPRFAEVQATVQPGDFIIVDCLYRLVADGNETEQVAIMLETLKRLAAETQAGIMLVDHFRKAGDEKARNRFAGSFVKQASASTLVAIEVTDDDLLVMNIDARTFHGCPLVYARFNLDSYSFDRVPEKEVADAKTAAGDAQAAGWIVAVWKSRPLDFAAGAADGAAKWGLTPQGAGGRFKKLVERELVSKVDTLKGQANAWRLTGGGAEVVKSALNLHPTLHP